MKTERIIIVVLSIILIVIIGKNDQVNEDIKKMNKENRVVDSEIQLLEFRNDSVKSKYENTVRFYNLTLDSLKEIHIENINKVALLSANEVKKELLQNIKIENDTSKPSGITESESKELLIGKRTLQYKVKKTGLENAKLRVENSALKSINYNLNAIIENKDVQLNNSDEVIELIRKGNRNKLIKVGGVCIGVGIILGLLL